MSDIEAIDSLFIAKHILKQLDINWSESTVAKSHTPLLPAVREAVSSIEAIENSWEHQSTSTAHTYGRKEKDETIKLWSVPGKTAQVLRDLVILTQSKNVLEIGTSAGYSTLFLADGAKKNNGRIVTIEFLHEKANLARSFFKRSGLKNITLVEAEAGKTLGAWGFGKVDFVFLDADKENYANYLDPLIDIMKPGAIIVADNVNDYGHLMENYLHRISGTHLPKSRTDKRVKSYYLAALDNGLIITKKL